MSWKRVNINTPNGIVLGIAPIVLSASRATDIPAFYSEWFFERLKEGYIKWINPFNRTPQYISFEAVRVIVFWTKNPAPIMPYLEELDRRNIHYYFSVSVNDYEGEGFEPGLPSLAKRIEIFKQLSNCIGKERIIWRFDPLIMTNKIGPDELITKIRKVGEMLHSYTDKLVVSFVDVEEYAKVRNNFKRENVRWRPFSKTDIEQITISLGELKKKWEIDIRTCGEYYDLSSYGIHHNSCIDGELMTKLFRNDTILMNFLGVSVHSELDLFEDNSTPLTEGAINKKLKDPGQRTACRCIASKDIGQYDTCMHQCLYCYANSSTKIAKKNYDSHNKIQESIIAD